MKKILFAALATALLAVAAFPQAQVTTVAGNPNIQSYVGGTRYSPSYNWHGFTETAIAAGAVTVILGPDTISLADGRQVHQFGPTDAALTPVAFDIGANAETITPTTVAPIACPLNGDFQPGVGCVAFTGTFANAHGLHTFVGSGSQGVQEAIADAGSTGGGEVYFEVDCGTVTLNTGGVTTTPGGSCQVPANFTSLGGGVLVKTTITTSASYSIGTSTTTTAFVNACTALTAGTNCALFTTAPIKVNGANFALVNVLITANAASGAGAIRFKVWGYAIVQPLV